MAGVTGLFSIASLLTGDSAQACQYDLSSPVFEFASSLVTKIASMYVESGANAIFFVENVLPLLSADQYEQWASWLAPASNIVRFYEALPVLLLAGANSAAAASSSLLKCEWDCILCPNVHDLGSGVAPPLNRQPGMASPLEIFNSGEASADPMIQVKEVFSAFQPVAVTTAGDLPPSVDLKIASRVLGELRQMF